MKKLRFNIYKVVINRFHELYDDLVAAVRGALIDQGHECTVSHNAYVDGAINILIGSTIFASRHQDLPERLRGKPYIVYQLEQLDGERGLLRDWPGYLDVLKGAEAVWEYSPLGLGYLAELGLTNVYELMPSYQRTIETFRPHAEQDIDVLFYGSSHPRRAELLQKLAAQGWKVAHLKDKFGAERNAFIRRSKVLINIHAWDGLDSLETVRLSFLLANHCFVVSETSDHNPYGAGVVYAPYAELAETCGRHLRASAAERAQIAETGYQAVRSRDMTVSIRGVLAAMAADGRLKKLGGRKLAGPAPGPQPSPGAAPARPVAPASGPLPANAMTVVSELERARLLAQAKDFNGAEAVYQRLIKQLGQHRDVLRHYGIFKLQNNDTELAREFLSRCLAVDGSDALALKFLGLAQLRLNQSADAIATLEKAALALPKDPDTHYFLSQAYGGVQRFDDAVRAIGAALNLRSEFPSYLNTLGALFSQKGQDRRALPVLYRALDLSPDYWAARLTLAHVLMRLGRHKEAISHYQEVMKDSPDRIDVLTNMGNAYAATDQMVQAEAFFHKLNALYPNDAGVFQNLGNLYSRQNRYEEALAQYRRALELKPVYPEAHNNHAITLRRLNRVQESLVELDLAVEQNPAFADARWNRSLSQLLLGQLEEGFAEYEWRWRGGVSELRPRKLGAPVWEHGASIEGKRLFVHSEQGLGDHIQFIRYLPLLVERGAKVYAEFPEPLLELCRFNAPQVEWIERGTRSLPEFDLVCPLMSLAHLMGTTLDTIPSPTAYLKVAAPAVEKYGQLLKDASGLKVGLVWSGNPKHQNDRNRSMALEQLMHALPAQGVHYVSLMKEARPADLDYLRASGRVQDLSAEIDTFMDTAGLIETLDLVISVDTSVAHLAGALGKPTWVLVPFAPDWRWMLDRSDTPWYSSMRLYRQDAPQAWDRALQDIGKELGAVLASRSR